MTRLTVIILASLSCYCKAAGIVYTSYFNNIHVYTNITLGGVSRSTWPSDGSFNPLTQFYPYAPIDAEYLTNIIFSSEMSAGVTDIFTVPAGYRAYHLSGTIANPTNANITLTAFLKKDGNYRRFTSSSPGTTTIGTNTPSSFNSLGVTRVLEEGDVLSLSNSIAGARAYCTFRLMPTNSGAKSARLFGLSTSPQVLYTVPDGKRALPLSTAGPAAVSVGSLLFGNDSGGSRTYSIYIVPFGASADNSTKISQSAAINNTGTTSPTTIPLLNAGTSVYVQSDSNTELQWAILSVYEYTP